MKRRGRSVVGSAVLALASVVLLGSSVLATINPDSPYLWHHYGVHLLIDDDRGYRGASCHYSGSGVQTLDRIHVRRPIAFGYDRSHANDHQYVGWSAQVQGTNDIPDFSTSSWVDVKKSPLQKAWTSEVQPAAFLPVQVAISNPAYLYYRVVVKMFWYYPTKTKVDGKAFLAVENLDNSAGAPGDVFFLACPASHPV